MNYSPCCAPGHTGSQSEGESRLSSGQIVGDQLTVGMNTHQAGGGDDAAGGGGVLGQGAVSGAVEDRDRIADKGGDVDAGSVGGDGDRARGLKRLAGVGAAGDIGAGFVNDAAVGAGFLGQIAARRKRRRPAAVAEGPAR